MSLAFHACPPPGGWFNDPCGLIETPEGYQLFVQHRADAPSFRRVGWGRLSSRNLADWTWQGVAIAPEPDASVFSGCVLRGSQAWEAFYTSHADATGLQAQVRRTSQTGADWGPAEPLIWPEPNQRDPFVIDRPGGRLMLLAQPPDWTPPPRARSHLGVWREDEAGRWTQTGVIGPWASPGVLWEMPCVLEHGGLDHLIISEVDRFDGSSHCRVRVWRGALSASGFTRLRGDDPDGELLDLGPELYAAIPGAQHLVGWLSSWAVARRMTWPGFAGGPISLPRKVVWRAERLRVEPDPGVCALFTVPSQGAPSAGLGRAVIDGAQAFTLDLIGAGASLRVGLDPALGTIAVRRNGPPPFAWDGLHRGVVTPAPQRRLQLFIDGPVVELFIEPEGRSLSAVLPIAPDGLDVVLRSAGQPVAMDWLTRG